jgi:hypothetical protein
MKRERMKEMLRRGVMRSLRQSGSWASASSLLSVGFVDSPEGDRLSSRCIVSFAPAFSNIEKEFWCLNRLRCGEEGGHVGGEAPINAADVADAVSVVIMMEMYGKRHAVEHN